MNMKKNLLKLVFSFINQSYYTAARNVELRYRHFKQYISYQLLKLKTLTRSLIACLEKATSSPGLFPKKNGWPTYFFFREKPWGRGCRKGSTRIETFKDTVYLLGKGGGGSVGEKGKWSDGVSE